MYDRDGRAPITLARNAPVAQTILRLANTPAFGLRLGDDIGFGLIDGHAIHPVRIHNRAGASESDITFKITVGYVAIGNNARHGQVIFAGKIKIALVMRRASKHSACAVIHQHEIGDIDRQVPAGIQRVLNGQASIESTLFSGFNVGSGRAALAAFLDKGL